MHNKSLRKDRLASYLTHLTEHIYSTIMNPSAWNSVLHELVSCTDSRSARLLVMNPAANRVISSCKLNIDDEYHQKYTDYYVNRCPWRKELLSKKLGQLYSTYLHFTCKQPDFYQTEFFNDWARPQNIYHGICGTIYRDSTCSAQLLIQRTREQGHYTEDDTLFVNDFIPHFQQAFLLNRQLNNTLVRGEAITIAAEGKRLPFVLLNSSLRIIYSSEAAEKLISSEPVLTVKNGQLQIIKERENHCLQRLLQKSLAAADSRGFCSMGGDIEVQRSCKLSLQLQVRPIHPDILVHSDVPAAYVAVYLYDFELCLDIDYGEVSRFYSLSKAETRVIMAMVTSSDLVEATKRCCISMNTLRSHLKVIFAKTETHSQASLMKLLLAGPFKKL